MPSGLTASRCYFVEPVEQFKSVFRIDLAKILTAHQTRGSLPLAAVHICQDGVGPFLQISVPQRVGFSSKVPVRVAFCNFCANEDRGCAVPFQQGYTFFYSYRVPSIMENQSTRFQALFSQILQNGIKKILLSSKPLGHGGRFWLHSADRTWLQKPIT